MDRKRKSLKEPVRGKKDDNKRLSKMAEKDSAQMGKKREKRKTSEMGMPRRAYLSTSQRRWPTKKLSKNQS